MSLDACTLVGTFSSKNLGNAILLIQEPLLMDFVEQAFLAVPGRKKRKKLLTLFFRADVAHLNHDERVLPGWPRS